MAEKRVLIIERDVTFAEELRLQLLSLGFSVPAVVCSGQEAVAKALEIRPDLLLTNAGIVGEINGVEATDQIRARLDIPVVFLADPFHRPLLDNLHLKTSCGCLVTPFSSGELQLAIATALSGHRVRATFVESHGTDQPPQHRHVKEEPRTRTRGGKAQLDKAKGFGDEIVRSMIDGIAIFDREGRFTYLNPAASAILGYEPEELLGRSWREFVPEDQLPIGEAAEERRAAAEADRYEIEFLHRDGRRVPVLVSGAPRFESGQLSGTLCVLSDLTTLRSAEAALGESLARERAILQALPDLLFIIGRDGTILDHRAPKGVQLYAPSHQFLNKSVEEVLPAKLARRIMEHVRRSLETGKVQDFQYELAVDREMRYYQARLARAGEDRVLALVHDETAVRKLQRQAERADKMQALGQLAANVAHDFNNILMVISGTVDLMRRRTGFHESLREDLAVIERAIREASGLTSRLLAFGRRQPMAPVILDLSHVVAEMTAMLHRLLPEDISLKHVLANEPVQVRADRAQIEQVVVNLCINARDAMPAGGHITIETGRRVLDEAFVATRPWAKEGSYAFVSVSDTGVGMDQETMAKIFDPFFTTKSATGGTGLGLASVYGTVKQHGGVIDVESAPGQGTTFWVLLPDTVTNEAPVPHTEPPEPSGGRGETVLVVDDHDGLRNVMATFLESLNYHILTARDGAEAWSLLSTASHDVGLVISDVTMPKMGGAELYRKARQELDRIPFLFCCGSATDRATLDCGGDPLAMYLHKPFDIHDLAADVRRLLNQRSKLDRR